MENSFLDLKYIIFFCISIISIDMHAQLGFCQGNSGDPIFTEDFGVGTINTALPAGTTTYVFSNGFPDDGFYTVDNGTFGNGLDWHQVADHTPADADGKCLIVQAGPLAGEFYRTSVSGLCENTTYEFSAWIINLVIANSFCASQAGGTIPINVRFEIWDDTDTRELASGDTGNIIETSSPEWRDYGLVFQTLPAQTSVILKMINNGAGGCGNDLAIDDIVFKSCGDSIAVEDTSGNTSVTLCSSETPYADSFTAIPDFQVFTNHFYQWQVSTDGLNWTDVVGETNATISVAGITATTLYRAKVAEFASNLTNSDCITFSDEYQILVNPSPNVPVSAGDASLDCITNSTNISVTGVPTGILVDWYDAATAGTLLASNSTSLMVTLPGNYYAEARNAVTGCISASRVEITVSGSTLDDASFNITPTCDGATVNTVGSSGGTFTFNPPPTDGAVINPSTGTVTNATAGESYTIEYNTSGVCSDTSTETFTVLPAEDASFNVTATCDGAFVNIVGVSGGSFAFNPIPTDGAIIDAITGNVINGTSGASYTIEYTTTGACAETNSETFSVLLEDDASFSVTPNCAGGVVNVLGVAGGTFSFNPVPTDSAIIDPISGEVTAGTPGSSYTIEYTTSVVCPSTSTETLTVLALDDSSFTLTPTCNGATATITGDGGGVFSFNPVPSDGATIDAISGTISNVTAGTTYTVEYLTTGDCPQSSTQDVTIFSLDDASFTVMPTCDGGISTITGTLGGTFAFDIPPTDGAIIDVNTGVVSGGTIDTSYSVRYTTAGICSDSEIVTFNSSFGDDASFSITPICAGGIVTLTGTLGGTFSFNPLPTDGSTIDPLTGNVTNVTQGETYTIEYTTTGICPATSTQSFIYDLGVIVIPPTPLELCDDLGEVPGNEQTVFDLTEKDQEITGADASLSVSYYETAIDAQTQMNVITNPTEYTNTSVNGLPQNPQTLYVVVTNTDSGCIEFTTLTIRVLPNPIPTPSSLLPDLELCDVINTGDGVEVFNLLGLENDNAQEDLILNGESQVTLTYYESFENADLDIDPIPDPTRFENTQSPEQDIYVRMTSSITSCYAIVDFTIRVKPLPTVIAVTDFIQCELNTDGRDNFDLTSKDEEVLNGQNPLQFTVSYHESAADAEAQTAALPSPYTNLTNPQRIFVRITDTNSGCFISNQSFNLQVDEAATANPNMLSILFEACDDNEETDGNPANDSVQFDLSTQDDQVLDGQNPTDYIVSYYETEADANLNVNPIPNLYENITNPQIIYARVDNNTLRVQAIALNISALTTGLDLDANGTIDTYDTDGDGIFDLIDVDGDGFSDATDSNGDGIYEFVDIDGDGLGDPVDLNNDGIFDNQVDGSICFDVTELTLQVNPLPEIDLEERYILCLNTNGTEILDSPVIDTELSSLDYSFEWSLNGAILPTETRSRLEPTQAGVYSVVVTEVSTSSVTRCVNMDTTEVIESEPPILTAEVITQLFGESNTIEAIATGIGDYEYSLDGGPWQDSGIFTNVSSGLRVITARDKIGCGMAEVKVFVIDYPLYFTPNGDGNNDTWNIEGIGTDAKIYIFDRYGKLLKQLSPTDKGWNGTFNGAMMPTSDYWFKLVYTEPNTGNSKEFRSHFTLKR